MKYQVDLAGSDDYIDVTSDSFHQDGMWIVFFNFYRNMDGTVVEGAETKKAAFPVENVLSVIAIPEEEDED